MSVYPKQTEDNKRWLTFDTYSKVIDAGNTTNDTSVVYTFTNQHDSDVVLTNILVSCRCLHIEYSNNPIKPGGSGYVKVTFNLQEYDSSITRKIVVYSTLSYSDYSAILELKVVKK